MSLTVDFASGWGGPFEVADIINCLHVPAVAVSDGMVVVAEEGEAVEVGWSEDWIAGQHVCGDGVVCVR